MLKRLHASGKPSVACFMGGGAMNAPRSVRQVYTLQEAAYAAVGRAAAPAAAPPALPRRGELLGLFSGGTLCAEAQAILRDAGLQVTSNAPVAGVGEGRSGPCVMLDLGDDEFTKGRPHPMIDPGVRHAPLAEALGRSDLGAVLLDVVIGYGAHRDPAGLLAATVRASRNRAGPAVICSITGTDEDPQHLSLQSEKLEGAGVLVAPSNADAARWAIDAVRKG